MKLDSEILRKKLPLSEVKLNIKPSNRHTNEDIDKRVPLKWQELYNKAKSEGKLIYDNPYTYRLNDFVNSDEGLTLEISQISFSESFTLKRMDEVLSLDHNYWSKMLAIGGILETSDHFFIFGIRSGVTMTAEKFALIGGILDEEIKDSSNFLTLILEKELNEEVGIEKSDIDETIFTGMYISSLTTVQLATHTKLNISKEEVEKRFKEVKDDELSSIIFETQESILTNIKSLPATVRFAWESSI